MLLLITPPRPRTYKFAATTHKSDVRARTYTRGQTTTTTTKTTNSSRRNDQHSDRGETFDMHTGRVNTITMLSLFLVSKGSNERYTDVRHGSTIYKVYLSLVEAKLRARFPYVEDTGERWRKRIVMVNDRVRFRKREYIKKNCDFRKRRRSLFSFNFDDDDIIYVI